MLVKVFKKAALVLAVVMLLSSAALAASSLVGSNRQSGDESLERELEGGIKLILEGVSVNSQRRWLMLSYTITAEDDTTITIKQAGNIYDNLGNEFSYLADVQIAGEYKSERFIIGGIPVKVEMAYGREGGNMPNNYKVASVYPRVSFSVNGQTVNFRNVPGKQ